MRVRRWSSRTWGAATLVLALGLVPGLPTPPILGEEAEAASGDGQESGQEEDGQRLRIEVGAQVADETGSLRRVAEYEKFDSSPVLNLSWAVAPERTTWASLDWYRLDEDQTRASARLDLRRTLQIDAGFGALFHRLDHDPLTNLQSVAEIKATRSTDFAPGAEYGIRFREAHAGLRFAPPGAPWLAVRAGIVDRHRDGIRQQLSVSHCTSCHVTGQTRVVDQTTTDLTFGLHARAGNVDFDYSILQRDFQDDAGRFTAPYERAYHPNNLNPAGQLVTPFQDRLWFQDGNFEVGRVPEIKRTAHTFKAKATNRTAGTLAVTVTASETENETTRNGYDFRGYRARYTFRPKDNVRIHLGARHDEIETDTLGVSLPALVGIASAPTAANYPGPFNGTPITYQDWRRAIEGDPTLTFESFLYRSSLDRRDTRLNADLWVRPSKKGSMRVGYLYRRVDRGNVVLADGTGETTSHRLKASWNQRVAKRLRWNTSAVLRTIDSPYVAVDAAVRLYDPVNPGVAGGPLAPTSLQYYQLHALRAANLSNAPTQEVKLRSNVTWSPGVSWALSANARYTDRENDELNFSDWDQDQVGLGLNLWVATGPAFSCSLGLDHVGETTDAIASIPLMDG